MKEDNFIVDMKEYFTANNIEFEDKSEYTDSELKEIYYKYIDAVGSELVENIRYITQMYQKNLFSNSSSENKYINNIKSINGWN